jgi:hypothetical protein
MFCSICNQDPCVICEAMPKRSAVLTHQPILENFPHDHFEITGPDTLLYNYQCARYHKDWGAADLCVAIGQSLGMVPVFAKTHYQVHSL